jgi:hypothetical protein
VSRTDLEPHKWLNPDSGTISPESHVYSIEATPITAPTGRVASNFLSLLAVILTEPADVQTEWLRHPAPVEISL